MRIILLTILLYLSLHSYAIDTLESNIEVEEKIFKSPNGDSDSYNAFDVLSDQDRYKNETETVFDVTEGNDPVEENITQNSTQSNQITYHAAPDTKGTYHQIANLVAINKITARSKQLSIKVGHSAYFGNIEIAVEKCWNNGDVYNSANKILMKVIESKLDEDSKHIFYGWMVSSNIPVSSLQDPVYELIAMDCHDNLIK